MPERDPSMRPDGSEIQASTPIEEPLIASDLDTLLPMEESGVEKPFSPQETARYKQTINQIKEAIDGTNRSISQASLEIYRTLLPLIQRLASCFSHQVVAEDADYLTDPEAKLGMSLVYLKDTLPEQELVWACDEPVARLMHEHEEGYEPPKHRDWTKAHCVVLTDKAELYKCTYLWNPTENPQYAVRPNWDDRETSDELWINYADTIVDLLTDQKIGESKEQGRQFWKRSFGSDEPSF